MQMLPNGDLWTPPTLDLVKDEAGTVIDLKIVPREDTVDIHNLPARQKMTPDVAAILMADLERGKVPAK